jgi:WXG100 family type VII secretion target
VVIPAEDWDLVGGNPVPGEPDAVAGLASQFRTVADDADNVHRRLQQIKDSVNDAIWKGKAANEFRDKLEKLPEHFSKLHESYDKAADGTSKYAGKMRDLQGRAATEAGKAHTAHTDQTTSEQTRDAALAADPTAPTAPHDDAIAKARTHLQSAIDEVGRIRSEFQAAEGALLDSLHDAHDVGMHNRSWFQKALSTIADIAEHVAFVLAVIAIIVVVVVAFATGGGFIVAMLAGLAAAEGLFTAATVASAVALVFKWSDFATGDEEAGSLKELIVDSALAAGSFGVGKALGVFKLATTETIVQEFTSITARVRPAQFLGMVDDIAVFVPRTVTVEINVVRVTTVMRTLEEAHLGTLWDIGWSGAYEIPKYLMEHGASSFIPPPIRELHHLIADNAQVEMHHVQAGG